jgi:exopolysaccharide biosynthesis WecB/TagA/CpsF family protein
MTHHGSYAADASQDHGAPRRRTVSGVEFDNLTLSEAVDRILELAHSKSVELVVTTNLHHLQLLQDDEEFGAAYARAAMRLADGRPILVTARLRGVPLKARVTGAELMPEVCRRAASTGTQTAIVGGGPGVADRAADRLVRAFPGLPRPIVVYPPYGFEHSSVTTSEVIERIRLANAAVCFVALGAPKQEKFVASNAERLPPGVYLCVGAAVDFAAGTKRRAPQVIQRLGLEWLFRLSQEPRRLFRRYLRNLLYVEELARALSVRVTSRRDG